MNMYANPDIVHLVADNASEPALGANGSLHTIKTESHSPSPGLSSPPFQFTFRSPVYSRSRSHPEVPASRIQSWLTFRPAEPFAMPWSEPGIQNTGEHVSAGVGPLPDSGGAFDIASLHQGIDFGEEYDDLSELMERSGPPSSFPSLPSSPISVGRAVRRRSSKACDQCRKSKCKCDMSALGEPCKNCVILGTPCTFLGPSKKRGPPKGYIDAIEARLHQTEAILGILMSSKDERAQSLLRDIAQDPLASAIINRVDHSPYGSQRHKGPDAAGSNKARTTTNEVTTKVEGDQLDLHATHPSYEWQAQVITMLDGVGAKRHIGNVESQSTNQSGFLPSLTPNSEHLISPTRRQRRRIEPDDVTYLPNGNVYASKTPTSVSVGRTELPHSNAARSMSPLCEYPWASALGHIDAEGGRRRDSSPHDSLTTDSEDDLAGAAGQLSLNEDSQVRYHGKASGLHLLGDKDRIDRRNEGGIWRFPKAGVWPPLPSDTNRGSTSAPADDNFLSYLPDVATQEHLINLYFAHVHPSFPVVHKKAFFDVFSSQPKNVSQSEIANSLEKSFDSLRNHGQQRTPTLLLLAMYAIAARYSTGNDVLPKPPDGKILWVAGNEYLDRAKVILNGSYANSRISTCQALLLMGYREIGVGAMAQAWIYIGMAIRMAQDLGLHRRADGWVREGLGGRLFNEWELRERNRVWYACVIMDKYVSTYIGRPLSIFESDYDTPLPSEDELEEFEGWSPPLLKAESKIQNPVPGRIISCFTASATLSGLLSKAVQAIYAVRPISSRHSEALHLENLLDRWYIELPDHLRHEPGPSKPLVPPPHILTLHMQYWCTVLLLHRPFIRQSVTTKSKCSEHSDDTDLGVLSGKSYEICTGAANHIASIVSVYLDNYSMDYCPVFLCYYIFTASIMHLTTLSTYPADPQAHLGMKKCMEALSKMQIVWPSAGRALELLTGSKVSTTDYELSKFSDHSDRHKRSGEQNLDVEEAYRRGHYTTDSSGNLVSRLQHIHSTLYTGTPGVYTHPGDWQPSLAPVPPASHPSYEPWPSESAIHQAFSGTISTSALPQLYSTGLRDEPGHGVRLAVQDYGQVENNRRPEYWNDYSTFSQLGTVYGSIPTMLDQTPGRHTHPARPDRHHPTRTSQESTYLPY